MAQETLLKVLIDKREWNYETFSRAYANAAVKLGYSLTVSEPTFHRWKSGRIQGLPNGNVPAVLWELFHKTAQELFAPAPPTPDPQFSSELEDLIEMTARDAQHNAENTATLSVSDSTVDQLRDDVLALAHAYSTYPALRSFQSAKILFDQANALRDRTQVPAQNQELTILAGQSCALLSQATFDLGHLGASARYARTASMYAENARFDPLLGFCRGTLAIIAYFTDRYSDAVRLARQAQELTGLGDTALTRLAAIEARAHAHLHDKTAARHALERSMTFEGAGTDELHDDFGGEFGFGPARLTMSNATTLLMIGDGPDAETTARHALDLVLQQTGPERSSAVMGKAAVEVALARLLSADLDGAEESLQMAWAIPPEQRVTGLMTRVATLRRALAAERFHGAPLAADLAEQAEDFTRVSAAAGLSGGAGVLELER